jgi:hypothetical protein
MRQVKRTVSWVTVTGLLLGCADPAVEDSAPTAAPAEDAQPVAQPASATPRTRSALTYQEQMAADQGAAPGR